MSGHEEQFVACKSEVVGTFLLYALDFQSKQLDVVNKELDKCFLNQKQR